MTRTRPGASGALHAVVNLVDERLPGGLKRLAKALAPGAVTGFYRGLQAATPGGVQQVVIRSGPLKGRPFLCSLRFERPYFVGNWEPEVVEVLQRHLRPGDTFFDVGGHVGYVALVAAIAVGDTGHVVTFEANPENARLIKANLALNPDLAPRIDVQQVAIWSSRCVAQFDGSAGSAVGRVVDAVDGGTITVEALTLDDFVGDKGWHCACVKMDIEGGEAHALPGMRTLLRDQRPLVIVEVHDERAMTVLTSIADSVDYRLTTTLGVMVSTGAAWSGRTQVLATPSERIAGNGI